VDVSAHQATVVQIVKLQTPVQVMLMENLVWILEQQLVQPDSVLALAKQITVEINVNMQLLVHKQQLVWMVEHQLQYFRKIDQ
jgi:hypothetical protein